MPRMPRSQGKGPSDFQNVLAEEERQAQDLLAQAWGAKSAAERRTEILTKQQARADAAVPSDLPNFPRRGSLLEELGRTTEEIAGFARNIGRILPDELPGGYEPVGLTQRETEFDRVFQDARNRGLLFQDAFHEARETVGFEQGHIPIGKTGYHGGSGFLNALKDHAILAPGSLLLPPESISKGFGDYERKPLFEIGTTDLAIETLADPLFYLPGVGEAGLIGKGAKAAASPVVRGTKKAITTGVAAKKLAGEVLEDGLSKTGHRILDNAPEFVQSFEHTGILATRGADIRVPLTLPIHPIEAVEAPLKSLPPVTYRLDVENISARGRELFETGRTDRFGTPLNRDRTLSYLSADEIKDIHLHPREVLVPNGELDPLTLKPGDTIGYKDGPGADRFIRLQVADDGSLFRTRRRQDALAEPKKVKLQRHHEGRIILRDLLARLHADSSLGKSRAFQREIDAGLDMLRTDVAVGRKQQLDRINLEMNVPRASSPDTFLQAGEIIEAPALRQEQGALMKQWLHHMPDEYYGNISLSFREGGKVTDIDRLTKMEAVTTAGGAYMPPLDLIEIFTGNINRLTMRARNYQQFTSPAENYIHETIHPIWYNLPKHMQEMVEEEFKRQKFLFDKDIRQVSAPSMGLWTLTRKQPGDADFGRLPDGSIVTPWRESFERPRSKVIEATLATTDEYVTPQRFGSNAKNENYRFVSVQEFFSEMLTDKAIRDMMPQDVQMIADKLSSRLKHISIGFYNLLAKKSVVLDEFADKTPITEQIYRMVFQPTGAARMHPIGAFRKGSLSKTDALGRIHEMSLPGAQSGEVRRIIRAGGGIRTEDLDIIDSQGQKVPATESVLKQEEKRAQAILNTPPPSSTPGYPTNEIITNYDRSNPVMRIQHAIAQLEYLQQQYEVPGLMKKPASLHVDGIIKVIELESLVGSINPSTPIAELIPRLRAASEKYILDAQKMQMRIDEIRLIAEEVAIKRGMTSFGVNFPSGDPKFMGIMNEDIDDIILKGGGINTSEYKIRVYNRKIEKYVDIPAHGWVLKDVKNEAIANLNGNEHYPLGQYMRAIRDLKRLMRRVAEAGQPDAPSGPWTAKRELQRIRPEVRLHRILHRDNSYEAHLDTYPLGKRNIKEMLEIDAGIILDDIDEIPVASLIEAIENIVEEMGGKLQKRLREVESIKYQAEETAFQRGLRNQGLDYKFEPGIIGADDVVDDAPSFSGLLGGDDAAPVKFTRQQAGHYTATINGEAIEIVEVFDGGHGWRLQAAVGGKGWILDRVPTLKEARLQADELANTPTMPLRPYEDHAARGAGGDGLRFDPATNTYNGDPLIRGDILVDDSGRQLQVERPSGFTIEAQILDEAGVAKPGEFTSFDIDDFPGNDRFLNVRRTGRNAFDEAPTTPATGTAAAARGADDLRPLTDADHEVRIRAIPESERTADDNAFLVSRMAKLIEGSAGQPPKKPPSTTTAAPVPDETPYGTQLRFDLDTGREQLLRAKPAANLTDEERQFLTRIGQSRTEIQTKIADTTPNEVLAEVSGELDGVLRRAMAKGTRALPAEVTSPEAAAILAAQETGKAKILEGLKVFDAHTFQQNRAGFVSDQQIAQAAMGREAALGGDPLTAGARAAKKMGAAATTFDPKIPGLADQIRLTDIEHRALMQRIGLNRDAPNESVYFQRFRADRALGELLEYGQLPNESDSRLLAQFFGDELGRELLANRPMRKRVIEALGTDVLTMWKPIRSTADISATLRQGAMLSVRHPKEFKQAFGAQLRAFASESATQAMDVEMRAHAAFDIATDARLSNPLHISDVSEAGIRGSTTSVREEAFSSRLFNFVGAKLSKIPGGWTVSGPFKIIRMSDRAYSTFLNQQRWGVWKAQVEAAHRAGITIDEEFVEALNKWINIASGRGQVGQTSATRIAAGAKITRETEKDWLRQAVKFANIPMFAPLYRISRMQDLNAFIRSGERLARYEVQKVAPGFGRTVTENERFIAKMIAEDWATYSAVATGIGLMVHASGIGTINLNILSSDFGQMKFGSTRVDLWAGHRQILNLYARIATGESVGQKGEPYAHDTGVYRREQRLGRIEKFPDRVRKSLRGIDDIVERYLISGASPGPVSLAANEYMGDEFEGQTFLGENLDDKTQLIFGKYGPETSVRIREAVDQQVPFIVNEFADAIIEEGLGLGMFFGLLAELGTTITTIPESGMKPNRRPN